MGLCESMGEQTPKQPRIRKDSIQTSLSTNSSRKGSFSDDSLKKFIDDLFTKYDTSKDNYLNKAEVRQMMIEIAYRQRKNMSQESIDRYVENFMSKADLYGDGRIGRAEFYKFYKGK
jgi:Ca2+-binding EF-hand superfamily protein